MLTELQYRLLKTISPSEPGGCSGEAYRDRSKLEVLLGSSILERVRGRTVIDFGCGEGHECLELAKAGAGRVIGIDIRDDLLDLARKNAAAAGLQAVCSFCRETGERADFVVSVDAFEHFEDPAAILRMMEVLVKPGGSVVASFGPTWYHPLGGHLFSVFPWAHLLFSERALIRWRADFKTDGATRFSEVAGGLNQMTIRRFERLVEESPLRFKSLTLVPIRKLKPVHHAVTREFTTAIVQCELVRR